MSILRNIDYCVVVAELASVRLSEALTFASVHYFIYLFIFPYRKSLVSNLSI